MAIYKDVEPLEVFAWKSENEDFDKGVKFAFEKLDTLPTADVVEVKHGKWISLSEPRFVDGIKQVHVECSNCKIHRYIPAVEQHGYYYCPNCGAIMDGGNKNE